MGIIRAAFSALGGALADQWEEVLEPDEMSDTTVLVRGVPVQANDKRNRNRKGTADTISDGSLIHVYPNQFMILVDGGKIIDYTAEEGYFVVNNSSMPSMFNGQLDQAVQDVFQRVRFGGSTPVSQKVYYINMQEIKGIKFGTRNPINYFDSFYNAELFLRAHGTYSVRVTNPLLFFSEAIPRDRNRVDIQDINEQYMSEFLEALQAAINQMSVDGVRISHVTSKSRELGKYMADILDPDWNGMRGMEVQSVGISSISYDEASQKLINMRNEGAMLGDPNVREGYVQGAAARGIEAAGSNKNGSIAGFMGFNSAMGAAGDVMGAASRSNQQAAAGGPSWNCRCGASNTGKFCAQCGQPKPDDSAWVCGCGARNTGNFCSQCGKPKPAGTRCPKCGYASAPGQPTPKFCPECGEAMK